MFFIGYIFTLVQFLIFVLKPIYYKINSQKKSTFKLFLNTSSIFVHLGFPLFHVWNDKTSI